MRQLTTLEILCRAEEWKALARRVRRHVKDAPESEVIVAQLMNGVLHAWEHEGVVALAQVHSQGRHSVSHVAYAGGTLAQVLQWYSAWEAECRRYRIDEIRLGGRKGWLKISRRYGFGFEPDATGELVKRLM